ncbi:glycosyltransferase 87 family protein [Streptomyces sp. SL13]|uniref:Glycosyltransferase 87 family protein n=1 Tax=Streptantibioticus silvisoli TaxID=2705255 RepID=A0AA90K837_9ACTN|nr:glycosyltransferase 87 family protein [Streptantibioticus silvisoli]MDI5967500.1 glycosyltransferase 87 family protein [Streptantibioticus silvisoli]MDI5969583.1 glycosyltransferase 87 family protein [Streptantibioticus silvisoli]
MTTTAVRGNERDASTLRVALAAAPRRSLTLATVLLAVSLTGYAVLCLTLRFPMADAMVYRAEGMAAATGHGLYDLRVTRWKLPATYPPFAAIMFVPTSWLPMNLLRVAATEVNVVLLGLLAHLSFRFAGWPRRASARPAALLVAVALGIWVEPVFQTLAFGQINLALACLVLWDLSRPDRAWGKGIAIGIAAGVKLTPGLFAVYLLLSGRVKAAAISAASFAGTVTLGWLVLPDASWRYWTREMFDTSRVGKPWIVDNQSLQGMMARLLHTTHPGAWWVAAAAVTAVAGLAVAAWASRRGLETWGVLCAAITALLVSPISWSHHWVWCVPLIVVLAAEARRVTWRWIAVGAVTVAFFLRSMWLEHRPGLHVLDMSWWHQPLLSPYPVMGLLFLAVAAARVRARVRTRAASDRARRPLKPAPIS